MAIYNAIRKYGEDFFQVHVLAMAHSNDLPQLEIYAIREHDTFGINGYNLTAGGAGTLGRSFIISEETKQKIGAGNKGKVMTEVARKKMSESAKNRQTRNKAAMLL